MSHGTRSEGAPHTDGPVPPGRHAVVVGGGLVVESANGSGTTLRAWVPADAGADSG